ncbi:hypothetical protein ElyMa_003919400 [Elysia marginata]|uniref:Uncharacterized protein n=1 Tax=Elysia marginata TaxID=1093978 RepID=A0AAV4FQH6_9GAST|nr:hypothetical protein ElyMa_003919400 [Elysia marginata]
MIIVIYDIDKKDDEDDDDYDDDVDDDNCDMDDGNEMINDNNNGVFFNQAKVANNKIAAEPVKQNKNKITIVVIMLFRNFKSGKYRNFNMLGFKY